MNPFLQTGLADALASQRPTLWLVDDQIEQAPCRARDNVMVHSHRYDVVEQLSSTGWNITFSDYDWPPEARFERVVYRVSKEKALVHYLINRAADCLLPGGELILLGDKGEGIKTYSRKAQQRLGGERREQKQGDSWICQLSRGETIGEPLDDQSYPQLREIQADDLTFISKPGIFGWNKIDKGSAFLIEQLPNMVSYSVEAPAARLLDLGCGFGYLTLKAHRLAREVCCTDNNAAALRACRTNCEQNGISANIITANAADTVTPAFDLILCNPPFHAGFGVSGDLTDRFLAATARLLSHDGKACFVVNTHIPLIRKASTFFRQVDEYADNGHFKLFILGSPKTEPQRP